MQHVIIVIHLMLVLALIGVVLLQRSEGGGLGIGGGGGGGCMSNRGTANLLTRAAAGRPPGAAGPAVEATTDARAGNPALRRYGRGRSWFNPAIVVLAKT